MASLKFQNVIGFYRANNDAVCKDLKTAYLGGRLTPFVGAGLSVFCGCKLWPSARSISGSTTALKAHPDHTARHQPLLELGGGGHA